MRIALITPGFSASSEDWCIPALRNLALGLSATHDVDVYTAFYPPYSSTYPIEGVKVQSFGQQAAGLLQRTGQARRLVAAVDASHDRHAYDVVHGFWADQGGLLAVHLGRRLNIPSLLSVMAGELSHVPAASYGKRYRAGGLLGRYAARRADSVIVLSHDQQRRLGRDCPGVAATCLPFGVDTSLFRQCGEHAALPQGVNVLIVGSLVPVKGHETALRAFVIVRRHHPGLQLHIVGEGPLRARLQELAATLGIAGEVTFHRHVEHHRLPEYYRAASLCVLASHFETSALVIMEAAACGRFTAGSDVGSMTELVPAEYRCAPNDAPGLARVMERFLSAPERQASLQDALAAAVLADYSSDAMVERYAAEYRRLSGRGAVG